MLCICIHSNDTEEKKCMPVGVMTGAFGTEAASFGHNLGEGKSTDPSGVSRSCSSFLNQGLMI